MPDNPHFSLVVAITNLFYSILFTAAPFAEPTATPTDAPSDEPTSAPSVASTVVVVQPTSAPSQADSAAPTHSAKPVEEVKHLKGRGDKTARPTRGKKTKHPIRTSGIVLRAIAGPPDSHCIALYYIVLFRV